MSTQLVYIGAPLSAPTVEEIVENKRRVIYVVCKGMLKAGTNMIPLAPHQIIADHMSPLIPEQNRYGIKMANAMMLRCDQAWFYTEWGVSDGMMEEMALLRREGWEQCGYYEHVIIFRRGTWTSRTLRKLSSWFAALLKGRERQRKTSPGLAGKTSTLHPETA